MTYEESFLLTANDDGQIPEWAIEQIFHEHGSSLTEFSAETPEHLIDDGETILNWLGY